jgi:hypothetical protein
MHTVCAHTKFVSGKNNKQHDHQLTQFFFPLLLRRRPLELARTREAATLGAAFIRACTGFFIFVVAVDIYLRIKETNKADQHASSLQARRPEIIMSKWLMWQLNWSPEKQEYCISA